MPATMSPTPRQQFILRWNRRSSMSSAAGESEAEGGVEGAGAGFHSIGQLYLGDAPERSGRHISALHTVTLPVILFSRYISIPSPPILPS